MQTLYLKSVITRPTIEVGDYTIYNDFVNDPRDFEKNNVLYHCVGGMYDCTEYPEISESSVWSKRFTGAGFIRI